jgi:hypothetical protein
VTVDGYWIDNWIYCNRTLKYNTTESLRTPSVLQLTTEYITTSLQPLYPPQPLFWHPLPTLSWLLPNCRFPSSFLWYQLPQLTNSNSNDSQLQLTTENSEVYDLWSDCRGDNAFGIGCLAITRETGTLRPRACTLPSNVYSTACTSQY